MSKTVRSDCSWYMKKSELVSQCAVEPPVAFCRSCIVRLCVGCCGGKAVMVDSVRHAKAGGRQLPVSRGDSAAACGQTPSEEAVAVHRNASWKSSFLT